MLDPAIAAPAIAQYAAEAFAARKLMARQTVDARRMSLSQAEAHMKPWAAIACLAGADLPDLADAIADRTSKGADGEWITSPAEARFLVALDICPRDTALAVLAVARKAALDALPEQGDPNSPQFTAASALNKLAVHLGCPPYLPADRSQHGREQRNAA